MQRWTLYILLMGVKFSHFCKSTAKCFLCFYQNNLLFILFNAFTDCLKCFGLIVVFLNQRVQITNVVNRLMETAVSQLLGPNLLVLTCLNDCGELFYFQSPVCRLKWKMCVTPLGGPWYLAHPAPCYRHDIFMIVAWSQTTQISIF